MCPSYNITMPPPLLAFYIPVITKNLAEITLMPFNSLPLGLWTCDFSPWNALLHSSAWLTLPILHDSTETLPHFSTPSPSLVRCPSSMFPCCPWWASISTLLTLSCNCLFTFSLPSWGQDATSYSPGIAELRRVLTDILPSACGTFDEWISKLKENERKEPRTKMSSSRLPHYEKSSTTDPAILINSTF